MQTPASGSLSKPAGEPYRHLGAAVTSFAVHKISQVGDGRFHELERRPLVDVNLDPRPVRLEVDGDLAYRGHANESASTEPNGT